MTLFVGAVNTPLSAFGLHPRRRVEEGDATAASTLAPSTAFNPPRHPSIACTAPSEGYAPAGSRESV